MVDSFADQVCQQIPFNYIAPERGVIEVYATKKSTSLKKFTTTKNTHTMAFTSSVR